MRLLGYRQLQSNKGISFSKAHLWRKYNNGTFPRPIHISANRIAWLESEIDAWIKKAIAERDGDVAKSMTFEQAASEEGETEGTSVHKVADKDDPEPKQAAG